MDDNTGVATNLLKNPFVFPTPLSRHENKVKSSNDYSGLSEKLNLYQDITVREL